jgi:hypothetical protein
MRENNDRVHRFYDHLGFEKTGVTLEFAGEVQDIFILDLSPQSLILSRLARMTQNRW